MSKDEQQPSVNPYLDDDDPYDYNYKPFQNVSTTQNPSSQNTQEKTVKEEKKDEKKEEKKEEKIVKEEKPLPPPPVKKSSAKNEEKEDELKSKALELAKREAELERREREVSKQQATQNPVKKPNFPICYPVVYHNISDEVEKGLRRRVAYLGFFGWLFLMVVLVLNFLVACASISAPAGTSGIPDSLNKIKFVALSFLWVIVGIPGHFVLCYWQLYAVMRSCHVMRFLLFFVCYAIAIILSGFAISGAFEYGPSGILSTIAFFPNGQNGNLWAFLINLVMTALWILLCAYFVLIYILVIAVARKEGSLKNVKKKVKEEVLSQAADKVVKSLSSGDDSV